MNFVMESGPWMVAGKPLVVHKWDIRVSMDKIEAKVLPMWIKICNVPLEAWTRERISALASRFGKPLIIDVVTTNVCKYGVGRLGYARVLVEVDAKKEFCKTIEIVYRNALKKIQCKKSINISLMVNHG